MSLEYDKYIEEHQNNVLQAFKWLAKYMKDLIPNYPFDPFVWPSVQWQCGIHDASKHNFEEYNAYDAYFYGTSPLSEKVKHNFDKAFLLHIHRNPHHWQYWVLIHDDEPMEAIEMPLNYVIEMICDWWSFSWKAGNLFEIFDWYDQNKKHMFLHPNTRATVEKILDRMKYTLKELGGSK